MGMSREIKFRGKGKDNIWWYGSLYYDKYNAFINSGSVYYHESGDGEICLKHPHEVIIETIGEYTGHLNWYGNDIIRTDHFMDKEDGQQYLYHQIIWSDKYLCWYAKNCGNKIEFNELDTGNIALWVFIKNAVNPEIIGNIHETPELLK